MSRDLLVTSFSAAGAETYGRRCVDSWSHWPASVTRRAYVDEPISLPVETRLTSDLVGWTATKAGLPSTNPDGPKPTNYIWDARRFAVKAFVWYQAAMSMDRGHLIWLDGDTVTHEDIPEAFAARLLNGADVAYLGRGDMHPETGAIVFRIPEAIPLLRWCRHAYVMGGFAVLPGWTDCHVLRAGLARVPMIEARDLTSDAWSGPWTSKVDAFGLSPWAPYVQHFKGAKAKREAVCAH